MYVTNKETYCTVTKPSSNKDYYQLYYDSKLGCWVEALYPDSIMDSSNDDVYGKAEYHSSDDGSSRDYSNDKNDTHDFVVIDNVVDADSDDMNVVINNNNVSNM